MTALFEVSDVHYAYQDTPALAGLSLTVEKGQRIALLGANGSGKSTLLRLLDGLYFADRGEVSAFGAVLSEAAMQDDETAFAFRRRVGLVFQNPDVQLFNPDRLRRARLRPAATRLAEGDDPPARRRDACGIFYRASQGPLAASSLRR